MEKAMNNHQGRGDNSDVQGGRPVPNKGLAHCAECGVPAKHLEQGHTGSTKITGQCQSDGMTGC